MPAPLCIRLSGRGAPIDCLTIIARHHGQVLTFTATETHVTGFTIERESEYHTPRLAGELLAWRNLPSGIRDYVTPMMGG